MNRAAPLPAGKTDQDESFPVAWLLPREQRGVVLAYYRFARLADDIADTPGMAPSEKLTRLQGLENGLRTQAGPPEAVALHQALGARDIPLSCATDLLIAFRRDARNPACDTWEDLLDYCRVSAMPVGRFLLHLNGQSDPAAHQASDALCAALQITNHVQDCGTDWRRLRRLYIPRAWLSAEGLTPEALAAGTTSPALRRVLDRVLAATDTLIDAARPLPARITARRLRAQAAATVTLAIRLRQRLGREDPLAHRVAPSRGDWLRAFLHGLRAGVMP